jgi:hypothetical protein
MEVEMIEIGVGFWKGAGIPEGERVNTFAECGCCGVYHRTDFNGDCREDSERHYDLSDNAIVVDE